MPNPIRILHLSTHNEDCGIGKYQEMFLEAMDSSTEVHNEFFAISPNQIKVMGKKDYEDAFKQLEKQLKGFDVLHIQHEYSFYWKDELERAVEIARSLRKKVIVTIHTSANVGHKPSKLTGVGLRSAASYAKALIREKRFFKRFIEPLKSVDLILVHNEVTKRSLVDRGIPERIITKIVIPVPGIDFDVKTTEISKKLRKNKNDIIYATIGFLHRFKGIKEAVKALQYLPDNYKLAIIGGLHPGTDDIAIYDQITDLIAELGLKDRVYITGYVSDDNRMNSLIRECDICVYPYDREYYSNVSSAALNNALANHRAVVAYPTESFKEINTLQPVLRLTQSFSYYELARELLGTDIDASASEAKLFEQTYGYQVVSLSLISIYKNISK